MTTNASPASTPLQSMLGSLFDLAPSQPAETALNPFATFRVTYSAEVAWWWTKGAEEYGSRLRDKVNASIELCAKKLEEEFDVTLNQEYRCQFEGLEFKGTDPENLKKAAVKLSEHLSKFDCVIPLR